jgi:hypothetical protein
VICKQNQEGRKTTPRKYFKLSDGLRSGFKSGPNHPIIARKNDKGVRRLADERLLEILYLKRFRF